MNRPPPPLRETTELTASRELTPKQHERLAQGHHLEIAQELAKDDRPDLAAWVHELIWDFETAVSLYREVRHYKDALRCGLLSRSDKLLSQVVDDIESDPEIAAQEIRTLAQWLKDKHRPEHAASLWAQLKQASEPLAQALEASGDHLAACRALMKAKQPAAALDRIEQVTQRDRSPQYDALAAQAHWELGDVEQSADLAQVAMTKGLRDAPLQKTLACALLSLSYPIGAETILGEVPGTAGALGRYRATGVLNANYAGVAYSAMDRRHLEEVEVHLLWGDRKDPSAPTDPVLVEFDAIARAAAAIGHPAIRPIIALDPKRALMVLPHAEGPPLAQLIRPPGLGATPSRVVAIVLRMAKALLAAQAHGLNHGSLLPAQIVTDAAGRPMLGPFGAQLLSGYSATRTTTLDELIHFTAPEHRGDHGASESGDVYALGRIFIALWTGRYGELTPNIAEALPWVIRHAQSQDPAKRPSLQVLKDALKELRFDVATLSQHAQKAAQSQSLSTQGLAPGPNQPKGQSPRAGIRVDCDASCSPELLDALCQRSSATCQSILDREGRRLWLAPWPSGTRRKDANDAPPDQDERLANCLPTDAPSALLDELKVRVAPEDWVQLPCGETMLELVGLFSDARHGSAAHAS